MMPIPFVKIVKIQRNLEYGWGRLLRVIRLALLPHSALREDSLRPLVSSIAASIACGTVRATLTRR